MNRCLPLLAISLIAVAVRAQAPDDRNLQVQIQKLVAMHRAWGPKMNTPGASVELKETARSAGLGGTTVKYRLQASGLDPDKVYALVMWPLGGPTQTNLTGVTIDTNGVAVCAGRPGTCGKPENPNDPIDLVMQGALGEPKRVGLIASDNSVRAVTSVIPFPIEGVDGACRLDAVLLTPNAEAVMLSASGFAPGARLTLDSSSGIERKQNAATADDQGRFEQIILPFQKGIAKGRVQATVSSGDCKPSVVVSWGAGSAVLQ